MRTGHLGLGWGGQHQGSQGLKPDAVATPRPAGGDTVRTHHPRPPTEARGSRPVRGPRFETWPGGRARARGTLRPLGSGPEYAGSEPRAGMLPSAFSLAAPDGLAGGSPDPAPLACRRSSRRTTPGTTHSSSARPSPPPSTPSPEPAAPSWTSAAHLATSTSHPRTTGPQPVAPPTAKGARGELQGWDLAWSEVWPVNRRGAGPEAGSVYPGSRPVESSWRVHPAPGGSGCPARRRTRARGTLSTARGAWAALALTGEGTEAREASQAPAHRDAGSGCQAGTRRPWVSEERAGPGSRDRSRSRRGHRLREVQVGGRQPVFGGAARCLAGGRSRAPRARSRPRPECAQATSWRWFALLKG